MRKHDRINLQKKVLWFQYVLAWYLHAQIYIPLMESQLICTEGEEQDYSEQDDYSENNICQTAYGLYTYAQSLKSLKTTSINPYQDLVDRCMQFWKDYRTHTEINTHITQKNIILFDQFPLSIEDDPVKTIYEEALLYFRTHMEGIHLPKEIVDVPIAFASIPLGLERSFASALKLVSPA